MTVSWLRDVLTLVRECLGRLRLPKDALSFLSIVISIGVPKSLTIFAIGTSLAVIVPYGSPVHVLEDLCGPM